MKAARDESLVENWGLAGDRRWLLVDGDGRFVSQREERSLARVVVTYGSPAGSISLCVVTTTDQVTGERGSQPLKMLGRRRRFGQQLVFGQNMIPDSPGVIRTGDAVEVLQAA
jgi:uncharacterized protein